MLLSSRKQEIIAKCTETFAKAKTLWPNMNFDNVGVRFDLKGRAAGMACRRDGTYFMRFNTEMMTRDAFDHVINNTVQHETAHIVCMMNPKLGRNHDAGWTRVCRLLGGNGERCHSEDVVYGKGNTYEYTTDRGHRVRVSDSIHQKIQRGVVYTWRQGKGKVDAGSTYNLVGVSGRSIAAPAVDLSNDAWESHSLPVAPVVEPVQPRVTEVTAPIQAGESKAAISRRIMLSGHSAGHGYEAIISAMMLACGYDRQLARATFKANMARVGIPA
jgi:predicted SprT family Zn-dependent metalloprotease